MLHYSGFFFFILRLLIQEYFQYIEFFRLPYTVFFLYVEEVTHSRRRRFATISAMLPLQCDVILVNFASKGFTKMTSQLGQPGALQKKVSFAWFILGEEDVQVDSSKEPYTWCFNTTR